MAIKEEVYKKKRKLIKRAKSLYSQYFTVEGGYKSLLSDEQFIKKMYEKNLGRELDLHTPKRLTEKLNWLKINDRKKHYSAMVDKYLAKRIVDDTFGEGYTIPTLGVWDKFDDINFESLPDCFVLKCTHDSGSTTVIKDKNNIDLVSLKEYYQLKLSRNYYKQCREWPYKNVKPRIIAEPIIEPLGKPDSIEYKTTCFNGMVGFVTICTGIAHDDFDKRSNDHFDKDFNKMNWYVNYKPARITPKKPAQWEEIIDFSEKLSKGIPYLRVDTYIVNGRILFGEMTFYTWGGFMQFVPDEWDLKLGDMLQLPS